MTKTRWEFEAEVYLTDLAQKVAEIIEGATAYKNLTALLQAVADEAYQAGYDAGYDNGYEAGYEHGMAAERDAILAETRQAVCQHLNVWRGENGND